MAKVLVNESSLQDIADAIREKGATGTFLPSAMGDAIRAIPFTTVYVGTNEPTTNIGTDGDLYLVTGG